MLISDSADADRLPRGSVVLDKDGDLLSRGDDGLWHMTSRSRAFETIDLPATLLAPADEARAEGVKQALKILTDLIDGIDSADALVPRELFDLEDEIRKLRNRLRERS